MEHHVAQEPPLSEYVPNPFKARMEKGWRSIERMQKETGAEFRSVLGDGAYWEDLYGGAPAAVNGSEYESFDWLADWSDLEPVLASLLARSNADPSAVSVLHAGSGNSTLPKYMHDANYTQQTCVDVSVSVIEQMKSQYKDYAGMHWISADCTDLGGLFPDETFDLVVDKSTFDAICCHDEHALMLTTFLKEMSRVLKYGGHYVCISLHAPGDVLKWLHRVAFGWRVQYLALGKPKDHDTIVYICSRNRQTESLGCHWHTLLRHVRAHPDSDVEDEELQSSDEEGKADLAQRTAELENRRRLRLERRKDRK